LRNADDIYRRFKAIPWEEYLDVDGYFSVNSVAENESITTPLIVNVKVKDAIVDSFRNEFDDRPDVELKRPQVLFDLYIKENEVTISLNTSGIPLFQRGYREAVGDAPINEVVAASLIRLSKWDRKTTFLDPFCGSGTLLMEAALLASGIPSNIERQHYAFKNLINYDETVWNDIYDNALRNVRSLPCRIMGSDLSDEMILKTRRNLRAMSFGRFIETKVCSFDEITKEEDEEIFILTNPPYGERLAANTHELYENIGNWLKHTMTNSQAWIITSSEEGLKSIGLRPSVKHKVFNGDLECSFRMFETYAGSKRTHFPFDEQEETQEETEN
jgi:putative N6-adenine-specific DNA methylase